MKRAVARNADKRGAVGTTAESVPRTLCPFSGTSIVMSNRLTGSCKVTSSTKNGRMPSSVPSPETHVRLVMYARGNVKRGRPSASDASVTGHISVPSQRGGTLVDAPLKNAPSGLEERAWAHDVRFVDPAVALVI